MKLYDYHAEFVKEVLPNGLEIYTNFWDRPWIRAMVIIHSGGREDPVNQYGLAHFLEHVVSRNIPDWQYSMVKKYFSSLGGSVSLGATGYLSTYYDFFIPADISVLRQALLIFGNMLLGSHLCKEVDNQRNVVISEFHRKYSSDKEYEWLLAQRQAVFPNHRLGTWTCSLGHPDYVKNLTAVELQKFYDTHYTPRNMSVVILGGLPLERSKAILEESPFGRTDFSGNRNPVPPALTDIAMPTKNLNVVRMSDYGNMKISRTEYNASWALPIQTPRQALFVFNKILNQILFDEIREKRGLSYKFESAWQNCHDVIGFGISGKINPKATDEINALVRECIKKAGTDKKLFEEKLRAGTNSCFLLDLSGGGLVVGVMSHLISEHRIITVQETIEQRRSVTQEQVAEIAAFLSPERQHTFICRP